MKNFRLIVLVFVQLLLIGLAIVTFNRIGLLGRTLQLQGGGVGSLEILQGLIPLLVIIIIVSFFGLLTAIIIEFQFQKTRLRISTIEPVKLTNSSTNMNASNNTTEELALNVEQKTNEKYDTIRRQLLNRLDKIIETNSNITHKQISEKVLSSIAELYEITQGEIFIRHTTKGDDILMFSASYAYYVPEEKIFEFQIGEGLIGQVVKTGKSLLLDEIPEGYITVKSGLGSAKPLYLLICPWKDNDNRVFAAVELATFKEFTAQDIAIIEALSIKLNDLYSNAS